MRFSAVPLGHAGSPLPFGEPTEGEALRARAILDPQRAHEFLAGRLLLRVFVAEALGVGRGDLVPRYRCPDCGLGDHGAPGFALAASADDGARPLRVAVSMSRARGWALFGLGAVGDEALPRIGLDLAAVADFRHRLPDAAYSPEERRRLSGADDRPAEAARLWARKEALLKASGVGLRTDPASVETLGDPRVDDLDTPALGLPAGFAAAMAVVELPDLLR